MQRPVVSKYFQEQILAATPLELVSLSYQAAADAVREARQHLANFKIVERSRSIALAHKILGHLLRTLDLSAGGGDLPRELARLYEYMMNRLREANLRQADAPLEEVLGLLTTLGEAWREIAQRSAVQPSYAAEPAYAAESSYGTQTGLQPWELPMETSEQSNYSWSF